MQLRFNQVAIGQRFHWRGELYVKHNSLIAHHGGSGKQQFIARSELVDVGDEPSSPPPGEQDSPLKRTAVLSAFETYHAEALHCLEAMASDSEDIGAARMRLSQAREHFLAIVKG